MLGELGVRSDRNMLRAAGVDRSGVGHDDGDGTRSRQLVHRRGCGRHVDVRGLWVVDCSLERLRLRGLAFGCHDVGGSADVAGSVAASSYRALRVAAHELKLRIVQPTHPLDKEGFGLAWRVAHVVHAAVLSGYLFGGWKPKPKGGPSGRENPKGFIGGVGAR